MLAVQVENLLETAEAWCTFEHSTPYLHPNVIVADHEDRRYGHSAPGFVASEDLLICDVPSDLTGLGVGWVKLRVSADGNLRVKSQSYFMMRMTDRCPQGYHCTNGQVEQCAPGYFCPGDTLN